MSSEISVPQTTRACPDCGHTIPVYSDYPTWCDQCDWNIVPQSQKARGDSLFNRVYTRIGEQQSRALFDKTRKHLNQGSRRSASLFLAVVLATLVHLSNLAFIGVGVWILIAFNFSLFALIFAAFFFGLAWLVRPRFSPWPRGVLRESEFPALYNMVHHVAAAYGIRPIDGLVLDWNFTAALGHAGWRQRRLLVLGYPLFYVLDPAERIALVSHELGHAASRDPMRSIYLGLALHSLAEWHGVILPFSRFSRGGMAAIIGLVHVPIAYILLLVIRLYYFVLVNLLWRASQRAEYRADALAVSVAGRAPVQRLLERLHYSHSFRMAVQRYALNQELRAGRNVFEFIRDHFQEVPEREVQRVRRMIEKTEARLDTTHPPTSFRQQMLAGLEANNARVELSAAEWAAVDAELERLSEKMETKLLDMRRAYGNYW